MSQPKGFEIKSKFEKICLFGKKKQKQKIPLYGLKRNPNNGIRNLIHICKPWDLLK